MNVKIDSSCFHTGSATCAKFTDVHAYAHSGEAIMQFVSMVLERMTSQREDASDECMGVGKSFEACEDRLIQIAAQCLTGTLGDDPATVDQLTRERLRNHAVDEWKMSHHRN